MEYKPGKGHASGSLPTMAENKGPKAGGSLQSSLKCAFKHCSKYYGLKYRSIRAYQMQDCIDKMYSQLNTAPPVPDMKCGQVNTAERYFQGGVKSASGKGRIVPAHPRIWPFVENRIQTGDPICSAIRERRSHRHSIRS